MPFRGFLIGACPRVHRGRTWLVRTTGALLVSGTVLLAASAPAAARDLPRPPAEPAGAPSASLQSMLQAVSELTARLGVHDGGMVEQLRRANAAKAHDEGRRVERSVGRRTVIADGITRIAAVEPASGEGRGARDAVTREPATRDAVKGTKPKASAKKAKTACRHAGDGQVPEVVAAIFRCHLRRAGFSEQEIGQWTAEAVVVSKCESYWDPNIVVFDGRYLDSPHPYTGNRYSAAGVFQFIRKTADTWIDGGYANVKKPRLNIDAAARLFIHNRKSGFKGWEDWACAAANDGFKQGSVLPNYPGGPGALPDWAWEY